MNPNRPPIQRIQQLIALATDPAASEEEARTAALQAARSIRQHGLQLTPQEAAWAAEDGHYAPVQPQHPYGTAVTPQSRQMGSGTPRLPSPHSTALARPSSWQAESQLGRPGAPRFHVLNLDFKDEVAEARPNFAFPQALLNALRRST
jgi:hypothetical protein